MIDLQEREHLLAVVVLAVLVVVGAASYVSDAGSQRYNVVFVTVETTRADHIGAYGYDRNTTPNIDSLAEDSLVFTNVTAPSASTIYSMPAVFTSLYPVTDDIVDPQSLSWRTNISLVGALRRRGYSTRAVVAHTFVKSRFGFDRYFDRFNDNFTFEEAPCNVSSSASRFRRVQECFSIRNARETTAIAKEMLGASEPFFLWLHYFDPHMPYMPPERKYLERFRQQYPDEGTVENYTWGGHDVKMSEADIARARDRYDATLRYTDHYLGQLVDEMKQRGIYDDTILVVTADHAECLGEHNVVDHNYLYRCSLQVPLIVHVPGMEPDRIDRPVSTIDIFPTLLDLTGEKPERFTRGENLFSPRHRDIQYAEGGDSQVLFQYGSNVSIADIRTQNYTPGTSGPTEADQDISRELRRKLRALGYTEGSLSR